MEPINIVKRGTTVYKLWILFGSYLINSLVRKNFKFTRPVGLYAGKHRSLPGVLGFWRLHSFVGTFLHPLYHNEVLIHGQLTIIPDTFLVWHLIVLLIYLTVIGLPKECVYVCVLERHWMPNELM